MAISPKSHDYNARLVWSGNLGHGTSSYPVYGREYTISIAGKADLEGSADPIFRGKAELHNPEDLFISAIVSCHMLSYLALCARRGLSITAYEDNASGSLVFDNKGGGRFEHVTLHPVVTIVDGSRYDEAMSLHDMAHEQCYIASSCNTAIHHEATVNVEAGV
jgi:organic hydroperoxide reductase OsmC/OhrA